VLKRSDVVNVYTNPVQPAESSETEPPPEPEVVTGPLPDPLLHLVSPDCPGTTLPDTWFTSTPKPRQLGEPLCMWSSELWTAWREQSVMQCDSLHNALKGKALIDEAAAEGESNEVNHSKKYELPSPILCSAISKEWNMLATGLADGGSVLWDSRDGTPRHVLSRHIGPVEYVSFAKDSLVTVGKDDKAIHVYSLMCGSKTLGIEGPPTGIFYLQCFEDMPLALVMGALGPRLYSLVDGSVFAAFSTEDEAKVIFERPSVHLGAEMLTMMAHRPPPPLPAEEEPPPPEEGEEEPPPRPDIAVPVCLETIRIANAYHGRPLSADPMVLLGGGQDLGATNNSLGSIRTTKMLDQASDAGSVAGRGSSIASRSEQSRPLTNTNPNATTTQNAYYLPPTASPFDGFPANTEDFSGKVTTFLRARHGERRLRDIRQKKRRTAILEYLREQEGEA